MALSRARTKAQVSFTWLAKHPMRSRSPTASPRLQVFLGCALGSGSTVNAPFGHPLHVAEWPKLLCNISHASLERPPRCESYDHLTDVADMIGRRPLIDDHVHLPQLRVPTKQPRGADKEWGLTKTQRREQCP
jgi:hypothetical protein